MAEKLDLPDIGTLGNPITARAAINSNFTAIENAFDNTLSRDGTTPNQMEADIDLNGNDLLNVKRIDADELYKNGVPFEQTVAYANKQYQLLSGTGAQTSFPLDSDPGSLGNLYVSVGGSDLKPGIDYNYSGMTLTFAVAPASGSNNIYVRYDRALPTGVTTADSVAFLQSGSGAVSRGMQDKNRDHVSVLDFGADKTGVVAADTAFQSAINSLPASGGEIEVPTGTYKLDVTPTLGTKSIQWNISAGTVFTGTVGGTNVDGVSWPRANTNYTLVPFGVFNQVRTSAPSTSQAPASAIFEALQPAAYAGNSVAVYAGARGSGAGNVWAMNPLISADSGATGTFHGIELDVNCFSSGALVKGLGISGVGTQKADVAIEVQHGVGWNRGVDLLNCDLGVQIRTTCATAIAVYAPSGGTGTAFAAKQKANGNDTIWVERAVDAAVTGYFLRFRNAGNSADLVSIDAANGSIITAGLVTSAGFTTTGTTDTFNMVLRFAAPTVGAGVVGLGNATSNTVGAAGGATALPATPVGYWTANFGGTNYKIPFYNV